MERKKQLNNIDIITVISFAVMMILNILANLLPINGQTSGEVSDTYANLFAPAGYTFSIWGLIYILLTLYTVYQLGFFRKDEVEDRRDFLNTIGIFFSVSSLANAAWILAWHYEMILISTMLISIILFCLAIIDLRFKITKFSLREKIFIYIPFSVYFAWITVATIANIVVLLVSLNWSRFGISESVWTMIILILGFVISYIMIMERKNIAYGLVVIWSYMGIYIKHISKTGWDGNYPLVIGSVTVCIVLLIFSIIYKLVRKNRYTS